MSKKIMVADDSRTIQRAVEIALSEEDVELIRVMQAGEVLSLARDHQPDAILLDSSFNQTGTDGYALCSELKQDHRVGHTPVAFLAGQSYDSARGEAAGGSFDISKPFDSKSLIEGIHRLIELSASATPLAVDSLIDDEEDVTEIARVPSAVPIEELPMPKLNQPVPRETMAMATFNPVAVTNMLPPDAPSEEKQDAGLAMPPPPFGGSAPASPADLLPADDLLSGSAELEEESLSPPPPFGQSSEPLQPPEIEPPPLFDEPVAAATPPPLTPPPLDAAPLTPPPLPAAPEPPPAPEPLPEPPVAEIAAPPPFPTSTPAPSETKSRQKPLIIPQPSDEPREFPVKDLFSPKPAEPEDELELEAPEFIQPEPTPAPVSKAAPAPVSSLDGDHTMVDYIPAHAIPSPPPTPASPASDGTPKQSNLPALAASAGLKVPSFALHPDEDYLARALSGRRKATLRPASKSNNHNSNDHFTEGVVRDLAGGTIERIAWEVVPELAELIIREMIDQQR